MDQQVIKQMVAHMRNAKLSEATIFARTEVLSRLGVFLDGIALLAATPERLYQYQVSYSHNAPATVNIYTRHLREFYGWAVEACLIEKSPAAGLAVPKVRRGKPHPTLPEDMQTIFSCVTGHLRTAYILAAFAGLRCGEICRLHSRDLYLDQECPTALIKGKGGKERYVPLLSPVINEIGWTKGWIIAPPRGPQFTPNRLSCDSTRFLTGLGVHTTLHSMRHYYGTETYRITHDPLLVRDLMGHESVATTEIYTESNMDGVLGKLAPLVGKAERLLRPRHLAAVSND